MSNVNDSTNKMMVELLTRPSGAIEANVVL